MELATIELPYRSRRQVFHFYFLGDVHLGSASCDEDKFDATIAEIKQDPDARVFLMGDLAEFIPRGEWRWREENVAEWVDQEDVGFSECNELVRRLYPIHSKIVGALQGNHELELEDTWNQAVHRQLCRALGVRDLGYMALVRLVFRRTAGVKNNRSGDRHTVDLLLHHGFGGGRSDGADANRFNDIERDYDCDWVVMGHTHRYYAAKSIQHRMSQAGELDARTRLRGRSGTFLRTITKGRMNYAEKTAMRPLLTGALRVTYKPDKQDCVAEI